MYPALKRCIDVALSAVGLIVTGPILLAIAILIKLDSRGPALYRQQRIGAGGQPFTMLKFRTMCQDADDAPHREAIRRAANGERTSHNGKQVFKSPADPRITRFGRFLRASCLDELPQLVNVLRGEMSLVGPRPALAYELEFYKDWHHQRFSVRPGLTGLWQVRRATAKDFDDMMRLDVEYCTGCSFWTDAKLIAMTIPAIVKERGVF